jgi:hypothetical protein
MTNAGNHDEDTDASTTQDAELQAGRDYYIEHGWFVFTEAFLLKRGYCCENGCRHCPYGFVGGKSSSG